MELKVKLGEIVAAAVLFPAIILLSLPFAWWNAIWGQFLWGWFVTPLFGIAVPSIWLLAGFFLTVGYFVKERTHRKEDTKNYWYSLLLGVLQPPCAALIGYIIYTFLM